MQIIRLERKHEQGGFDANNHMVESGEQLSNEHGKIVEHDENDEHDEIAPNKGEKVGYGEQIGARQDERCFPGRECPQRQVIEI